MFPVFTVYFCANKVTIYRLISYITKMTNKMQKCRLIYYSLTAEHVSSDIFAHHQEYLTVFTASGVIHVCGCLPAQKLQR